MRISEFPDQQLWRATLCAILMLSSSVGAQEAAAPEEAVDESTVLYAELDPTFVTNVGVAATGRLAYIKTDVALQIRGPTAREAVTNHKPALRSIVIMALSRQDENAISTTEGRETLKKEALTELQAYLVAEEKLPMVEDLLFTNFIVQR
jgi:flagellar protein FliL